MAVVMAESGTSTVRSPRTSSDTAIGVRRIFVSGSPITGRVGRPHPPAGPSVDPHCALDERVTDARYGMSLRRDEPAISRTAAC